MRSVGGVLLTGGASRRLGAPKSELLVDGERLADRAARVLSQVCDPAVEVGRGASALACVREEPAGSGPLAAFAAGVTAIRSSGARGAVLVLAVDLPFVDVPLLEWLAHNEPAGTLVPTVAGRAQSLCARYAPDALDHANDVLATGERSMHALLDRLDVRYADESDWRAVADARAFLDVDTEADVARAGLESPG